MWFATFTRPAIAIFLFVSGALWKANQDPTYLLHKIKRVIFPYLFFSILAFISRFDYFSIGTPVTIILRAIFSLLGGATLGPYYFVFLIITIYFTTFMLDALTWTRKALPFLTIFALALNLIHAAYTNELGRLFGINNVWINVYAARTPLIWLCYFLLGIAYKRYALNSIVTNMKIPIRIIWFLFFMIYGGLIFSKTRKHERVQLYYRDNFFNLEYLFPTHF